MRCLPIAAVTHSDLKVFHTNLNDNYKVEFESRDLQGASKQHEGQFKFTSWSITTYLQ